MKKKLGFASWLEKYVGITWAYFDNNYEGKQADEVYEAYDEYLASDGEEESA